MQVRPEVMLVRLEVMPVRPEVMLVRLEVVLTYYFQLLFKYYSVLNLLLLSERMSKLQDAQCTSQNEIKFGSSQRIKQIFHHFHSS